MINVGLGHNKRYIYLRFAYAAPFNMKEINRMKGGFQRQFGQGGRTSEVAWSKKWDTIVYTFV